MKPAREKTVLVIHGPNLNMLGKREPDIYGHETLDMINHDLIEMGKPLGIVVTPFQSNSEADIIEKIHTAFEAGTNGIIINPAAFTHTSIAIKDALLMLTCPIIEIHLSNIYQREGFRHKSVVADVATGQITGLGSMGYTLALTALAELIQ